MLIGKRDVFSFTMMISRYANVGQGEEALRIYRQMQEEGVKPNAVTFTCVLKACSTLRDLQLGREIHACIRESGLKLNVYVGSALIDMYAKSGSIKEARQVFDGMGERNVVTWSAMIAGYAQHEESTAITLFQQMQQEDTKPNEITITSVLKACTILGSLEQGREVHSSIEKHGLELNIFVGSALVDMYSKCGSIVEAREVFDGISERNEVLWSAMIAGYAQYGYGKEALSLFRRMQEEGVKPDEVTFACALKASAGVVNLEEGKWLHSCIIKNGFELNVFVGSALIDMYGKCGSIEYARKVFDGMYRRNVVSWNAMIAGYAQNGKGKEALTLFQQMQEESVRPDEVTFISILKACASLRTLEEGKQVHECIKTNGFELNVFIRNTLIDMYAKCGSINEARQVFDGMRQQNVISWNAMIGGYAQHGLGKEALSLFEEMVQEGVKPNESTFVSLLSACSHEALITEAGQVFDSMSEEYGITPTEEHYACLVDVLGRLGHLVEAEEVIHKMPIQPTAAIWMALLGACRTHGNMEIGRRAYKHTLELGPKDGAAIAHVTMLSDIFCSR